MNELLPGGNPPPMIYFSLPDNRELLACVGTVALLHGNLDRILAMTIKSLAGVTVAEALHATARNGSAELRKRIHKLARARLGEGADLLRLEAILNRCALAAKRRNELLHSIWARQLDGEAVVQTDDHGWKPLPSVDQITELASTLSTLVSELNDARLHGFLRDALLPKQRRGAAE